MLSFITGSRAYGCPTDKSDIDLVIRCDDATAHLLRELSDTVQQLQEHRDRQQQVRFGRLNLIVCTTDEQFAVWRLGTTNMARQETEFDKKRAKAVLDGLRDLVGLKDNGDSGDERST